MNVIAPLLIPQLTPEFHRFGGHPPFAHFAGGFMFFLFLLLLIGTFALLRRRSFGPPPWVGPRQAPEFEARKVLAERFARGEISTDEFLERASVLNWTPGSDTPPPPRGKRPKH